MWFVVRVHDVLIIVLYALKMNLSSNFSLAIALIVSGALFLRHTADTSKAYTGERMSFKSTS